MFDWLFDGIEELAVLAVHGLIAAFAAVLSVLFAALPDMPALPELPSTLTMALEWVAWVFPVDTLVDVLGFVLAMWLLWQAVAIALRWARALGDA